jgi:hypothetical protein
VASLLLGGCAGKEELAPVQSTSATTSTGPSPTAPPDAGPPKRTVLQRNPMGNVAETENLLFDGDFEWTSPFSDEYGWFQGQSPTVTDVVVGPDCRSGVKCARLKAHQSIVGIGVASKDSPLEASVWVRFEDTSVACSAAKATLVDRFIGSGPPLVDTDNDVKLTAREEPDQSGWCHLVAVAPARQNRTYLNVFNTSGSKMLVDDAVLKRLAGPGPHPPGASGGSPGSGSPPAPVAVDSWVPTQEEAENLAEVRALLAEYAKPHDGPPTPAQKAFERFHGAGGTP